MLIKNLAFFLLFPLVLGLAISSSLFEISSSILIVLFLISLLKNRDGRPLRGSLLLSIVVLFLVNLLSLTQTQFPEPSLRGVLKIGQSLMLCVAVAYFVDSEEKFKKIFYGLWATACVVAVDALLQGVIGLDPIRGRPMTPYLYQITARLTGPFHHANDFSAYLSVAIFLFLIPMAQRFKESTNFMRFFLILGSAIVTSVFLWTYARGAWLAVASVLTFYGLALKKKIVIFILVALSLWLTFFSPSPFKTRIVSLFNFSEGTTLERKQLWSEAVHMIKKSPVLGLGINTYARNEPSFKVPHTTPDYQYAHNGYLQIAAETGLAGLAAFLAVLFCFFRTTSGVFFRAQQTLLGVLGLALSSGILAFLLHSFVETNLQSNQLRNLLWFVIGMAWAARLILKRDARDL